MTEVPGTLKPSGAQWCDEFPCSKLTTNLAEPFRTGVERFIDALKNAGASVIISTTFRPAERAYLMRYAYLIAQGRMLPSEVPPMEGVDIDWTHGGHGHSVEAAHAAKEMVDIYQIAHCPVLASRHTEARAIDMTIHWYGNLPIKDAKGIPHNIISEPRSGMNRQLWLIGQSYGVIKLESDPPHWSQDGH